MTQQDEADLHRLILAEYMKNEFVSSSCNGKDKFSSFIRADKVARAIGFRHDCRVVAYHCQFCGSWHVGNARPESPVVVRRIQAKKGRSGVFS